MTVGQRPAADGNDLYVVGVEIESSLITGPGVPVIPAVTLHVRGSTTPGGELVSMRVHFKAQRMDGVAEAIRRAAADSIQRARREEGGSPG